MTLPSGPRARRTALALYVAIALSVVALLSNYSQNHLIDRARNGVPVSTQEAATGDFRHALIQVAQGIVMLICVIVFLNWLYNSVRNVHEVRGKELSMTPGWAVGYWFIPFVNLVRPYQTMVELWEGSREGVLDAIPRPPFGFWWASYLLSGVFTNVGSRMSDSTEISMLSLSVKFEAAGDLLTGIAGLLLIQIISAIDSAQGAWPDGTETAVSAAA